MGYCDAILKVASRFSLRRYGSGYMNINKGGKLIFLCSIYHSLCCNCIQCCAYKQIILL